jgi:uncharacterized protein DUF4189
MIDHGRAAFGVSVSTARLAKLKCALMRVALLRLLAVLLGAVGLVAGAGITAPTAGALGWGAIAISPDAGTVGYSKGYNSATEAEQAAVGLCKARDCRAVVNFTNACGAVAQAANTSWAWGRDRSAAGAQKSALISCSQYGAGCRIVGWMCS